MTKKINWRDIVSVLLGMCLLAFAITAILKPSRLVTGGVTGISIILGKVLNFDYTVIYYVLSIAVLIATYLVLGRREGRKIVLLSIFFPLLLMVFSRFSFNLTENDMFLASIYYGIIGGLGAGLILRSGYSTGGSDSIGKMIHKRIYPFISMNIIITAIDIGVVIASMFIYDIHVALYAIITQIVFLKSVETVMFGLGTKLMKLEIISDCVDSIENFIINAIKRGITKYEIKGGYTNLTKTKLVTICTPREAMLIKKYIAGVDRSAFVDILPVSAVWGEGVGFETIDEED